MPRAEHADFRLDAVIIGAQKAATTTLFDRLADHPGVSPCDPKEPMHFERSDWRAGMAGYAAMFPQAKGRVTLEASTTYSFARSSEAAAARLQAHNADLRVIYVIRDPIDRIVSAHRHAVSRGYALSPKLETALGQWAGLVDNTRYASRLAPFRARFGPDRVLVLTFDDLTDDQEAAVARAQRFLGLAPRPGRVAVSNPGAEARLHHAHDGSRRMKWLAGRAPRLYNRLVHGRRRADSTMRAETRAALRAELGAEIDRMQDWTGRDLSAWRV